MAILLRFGTRSARGAVLAILCLVTFGGPTRASAAPSLVGGVFAQSGDSTVAGEVRDASGGVLPGAVVTIRNEQTGVESTTVTNEAGVYRFAGLVPGTYRLDIVLDGFGTEVREGVAVRVGETSAVDVRLDIARQTETVTVTGATPAIEAQTSTISQLVTREMVGTLPMPNRAASSLVALAPGVIMINTGSGTAENYPIFSVAGGRARNQNFILDGGNASNAVGLTRPQQLTSLPVDAMQEFRVISNNYAAEYGHSTGGVITMTTRAGGQQYHGSVFESLQNDALNAKNYFAATKAPMRLNQFGGSLGGPVRESRTFFFGTWERTRQMTGQTVLSTVPTLANRNGDFSDLRSSGGQPITIYDPITHQPFPGNVIPADRLDPVALAALRRYPLPNRTGTPTNANNYGGNTASALDRDIVVARVDHELGIDDRFTARYYLNNSGTTTTGTFPDQAADPLADATAARIQSFTVSHTHSFGSTLFNELRFTYLRRSFIDRRPELGTNQAASIGFSGVSDQAFPAFAIAGYTPLGSASVLRIQRPITDRQVLDSLTWVRGRHTAKFGSEARFGANDEMRDRGSSGSLGFTPSITSNFGAPDTGNALASFLLGQVSSGSVQRSDLIQTRAAYAAVFAQDDWRVTPRLTLNYGVRWEVEFPRREINGRMNSFDPIAINPVSGTPGVVSFPGLDGSAARAFATDWNNVGPRFGFAYTVGDRNRTVVRGGTGIFYGPTVSNTIGDAASLGFSTSASFVASNPATDSAFILRNGFPAFTRQALTSAFGAVPVGQKPTTAVSYFDPNQVAPTSYQTNVGVQHEVARGLTVEFGFLSNVTRHLTANDFSINQVPAGAMGPGNAQIRRPYPQFSDVVLINPSIGRSTYYAGFVRVQKHFDDGFSLLAHYTRSRYMDNAESADEYGTTGSYMDAYHRGLDWALSGSDVPHHLVVTALYRVRPFTSSAVANALLGDWQIGVLQTWQSGPPFTVLTTANTTNAFPAGALRPDLVGDPTLPSSQQTLNHWFNTAAFANPAPYTFGNSPRSVLRGPGVVTTDLTIEKRIAAGPRMSVDVRAEAYNLLNRANFNIPGYTLGAPDFGVIATARAPRTMQLGARVSF